MSIVRKGYETATDNSAEGRIVHSSRRRYLTAAAIIGFLGLSGFALYTGFNNLISNVERWAAEQEARRNPFNVPAGYDCNRILSMKLPSGVIIPTESIKAAYKSCMNQ